MVGAFEILVRPDSAGVEGFDKFHEEIILVFIPVVFQNDQGMLIDLLVDQAFRLYDFFL